MLYALILAGGKGTRLYPLSRNKNPKQFLNLFNNESFLRNAIDRIKPIIRKENIYVVTNEEYLEKIYDELPDISRDNIFVEPSNKETATCIGLSAAKLLKRDKEAMMVVLPSDHYIEKEKTFQDTLNAAIELAERKRGLVTIGILPSRAETGYGYIEMGDPVVATSMSTYKVARFTEKPNVEVAKDFILKGTYLWNSGMFIWRADVFLREMQKYLPKLYSAINEIYQSIDTPEEDAVIKEQYELIDGISVDFGIMQKTRKAYVIKSEFIWDDIGSFKAVSRFFTEGKRGALQGDIYLESSENCSILACEKDKLIIGFGVKDLFIVDSGDVILIMDKSKDQELKHLVNNIKLEKDLERYM